MTNIEYYAADSTINTGSNYLPLINSESCNFLKNFRFKKAIIIQEMAIPTKKCYYSNSSEVISI